MDQHTRPAAGIYGYEDTQPNIPESAFIAPGAMIIGDVTLGEDASVWFNCTVRGDIHYIRIGAATNIQDNSVLHVTHGTHPLIVGDRVTCGHGVTLHGCTVGDESLIGIGSIVLDGAVIEPGAMVAAGALVPPGMIVRSGELVAGIPARPLRGLRDKEKENLRSSAERYVKYARQMKAEVGR